MSSCKSCNADIAEDARFCPKCGNNPRATAWRHAKYQFGAGFLSLGLSPVLGGVLLSAAFALFVALKTGYISPSKHEFGENEDVGDDVETIEIDREDPEDLDGDELTEIYTQNGDKDKPKHGTTKEEG